VTCESVWDWIFTLVCTNRRPAPRQRATEEASLSHNRFGGSPVKSRMMQGSKNGQEAVHEVAHSSVITRALLINSSSSCALLGMAVLLGLLVKPQTAILRGNCSCDNQPNPNRGQFQQKRQDNVN
jgi:hypothetical protein